jgi:NAD(P)-dependent dehydrogenase (short-subunit alcohol dehydrogenase family)
VARLSGRVAIVTGAGSGIGRETALLYAEEGARVVVGDIRSDDGEATVQAIADAGGDAIFVAVDVSKSDDVQELVGAAKSEYGALHVMTANAGILGRAATKSFVETSEKELDETMAVNFGAVARCFRYAIPLIQESGGGAMTATASLAAHRGFERLWAYCASKGAVVALVRAVAAELMPDIRVNAVSPGSVGTQIAVHNEEETGRPLARPSRAIGDEPFGRIADPRELAHGHLWLASDDASFVTGQVLIIDNGHSIIPA